MRVVNVILTGQLRAVPNAVAQTWKTSHLNRGWQKGCPGGGKCIVFNTGGVFLVGFRSVKAALRFYARLGLPTKRRPRVRNLVAVANLSSASDPDLPALAEWAARHADCVTYSPEPKELPCATVTLDGALKALVYSSGKVALVGGTSIKQAEAGLERVKQLLLE
jgi:TATA-box binding protein (TBP) (component of TFIID and TFIIIB)